jgi:2-polyprenyl-3-methyl-5-hydroxy-6-metoxy-1,4-benzoquinol methylase
VRPKIATMSAVSAIVTRPNPRCPACGGSGSVAYHALTDRNFGSPGEWNLRSCKDDECRTLWLDPVPSEQDIARVYDVNYLTHKEADAGLEKQVKRGYLAWKLGYEPYRTGYVQRFWARVASIYPATRRVMEFPAHVLAELPAGRLLDMGCGAGDMLMLGQWMGWQVVGVDFDPIAVQFAQARGLPVRLGTLEAQSFPEGSFDAVLLSHVIEHVHDPRGLLREIRRILAPGGRLLLSTPNASSWGHHVLRSDWPFLDPPRHLNIFSVPSLLRLCREAGFFNLSIHTSIRGAYSGFADARLRRASSSRRNLPKGVAAARIWGLGMTLAESLRLFRNANAGEEIDLTAFG